MSKPTVPNSSAEPTTLNSATEPSAPHVAADRAVLNWSITPRAPIRSPEPATPDWSPGPTLIAVAHGSRDPRSAATVSACVDLIRAARPGTDVRLAFLDLNAPSVDQVVDTVAAQGRTHAVIVPLLLGSAFHARVDLPGILAAARNRHPWLLLTQADVLGADHRLISALQDRVCSALGTDVPKRLGVAVAAVGSSSQEANTRTATVARLLAAQTGWRTEICFATTGPSVATAVSELVEHGAEQVLAAPWFLAPGLLTDRLATQAPDIVQTKVLGPHSALVDTVWDRYDSVVPTPLLLSA